jgi:DNA invertase Pin-like site-specific DNA recombinase
LARWPQAARTLNGRFVDRPPRQMGATVTAPGIRDGNRAVAYLRVSTDEQSASIEAQRSACELIAKTKGLQIVSWHIDEDVSGKLEIHRRPALSAALDLLESRRADRLIVAKLDRLARDTIVALQIDRDATKSGWAIVFGDFDIDTATAVGKMTLANLAAVAQFERDRISERTREALAVKRSQGVKLGRPPRLPDDVVKRIAQERASGQSLRAIAAGLTADKVPTAHGAPVWHASVVARVLSRVPERTCTDMDNPDAYSPEQVQ